MKAASERWFWLLLRLYPADFRDEMGEALVEAYGSRARDASQRGRIQLAGVWFAALWDSLRNGLGERLRPAVAWRRSGDWGRDMERVRRRLIRRPLFLAAVLGTLTVGLGTFAVVYTAVDKILLEPLPYSNPEDLYMIWGIQGDQGHLMDTGPEIAALQEAGGAIDAAAAFQFTARTLVPPEGGDAMRIPALIVSPNLLELLGVRTALGRGFRPEDAGSKAAVLADGLWRRLGGDPAIAGRTVRLSGRTYTVIGVMPPGFQFGGCCAVPSSQPDIYATIPENLSTMGPNDSRYHAVIRARHGAKPEEVDRAVREIGRLVGNRDRTGRVVFPAGLHKEMVEKVRPVLLALSFAAAFLLLVLTVNLASLLLARAAERERELAVSRALGASWPAVVRATLIEGGLLGLLGGGAGGIAGIWGTRLLVALGPADLPRRETIALDRGDAAVVIGVGVLLGLLAAILPAIWTARVSMASLLSNSAVRGGASSSRMRRGLIVVQVAISLVLLTAGGLVVRSFERLLAVDPGYQPGGLLTFRLGLNMLGDTSEAYAFLDRLEAELRALPGVTAVGGTDRLPTMGPMNVPGIAFPSAPGNTGDPQRDEPSVARIFTHGNYVEAMGMRVLEGRSLEARRGDGPREALIDRHLAEQFYPGRSPLGVVADTHDRKVIIVGVVDQARLSDLHEDDRTRHLIVRAEEYNGPVPDLYAVRTRGKPLSLVQDVRAVVRGLDSRVAVSEVRTMEEIVADARSEERISAVLIAGLALGALLLVAMGLFGMISGSVTRRRGELAVRLALGATHGRVIRLVVGEGTRLLALGLLIGYPGTYLAGSALQGLLVGVPPDDGPTLTAVAIGLAAVALLACYLGARRVTAIDPGRLLNEGG